MGSARDIFPLLLEHLVGRGDLPAGADPGHLLEAERLVERGRAVAADAPVPAAWIRRARKAARPRRSAFRLVFDSWMEPRPALRRVAGATESRFLRLEGAFTVDLEITPGVRGATVLGQVQPVPAARTLVLHGEGASKRVRVAADGTFRVAAVAPGRVALEIDGQRIEDVPV